MGRVLTATILAVEDNLIMLEDMIRSPLGAVQLGSVELDSGRSCAGGAGENQANEGGGKEHID